MIVINRPSTIKSLGFIILIFFLLGGCASTIQSQYSSGDHYGIINTVNKNGGLESASGIDLYYLCPSYLTVRQYNDFFRCTDKMEKIEKTEVNALGQFFTETIFKTRAYNLKSEAFLELGDWEKAIQYGEKSLNFITAEGVSAWKSTDYPYIDALGRLGVAYALSGEKEKALNMLEKLESYKAVIRGDALYTILQLGKIKICVALGDYNRAKSFLESYGGAPFFYRIGAGNRSEYEDLLKNFLYQKIHFETGDFIKSKAGYDELLKHPAIETNASIYYQILADRGAISLAEGNRKEAIKFYQLAVNVIELHRANINTEAGKIGFVGDKQQVYNNIVALLFNQGQYSEAFEYVERAKARALVDMLSARERFAGVNEKLKDSTELLAKLYIAEYESTVQDGTVNLDQASKQRAIVIKLKREIKIADPELASLVTVTQPDIAGIQQLIPPRETLIEYFGSGDTFYAFIVNRDQVKGVKLDVKDLRRRIELFRQHIMSRDSYQCQLEGQSLYEKLIKPLERTIQSTNLTIVPHGALHYLPFNALNSGEEYLIDRYNIRVLPSASVMKFLKDRREGHAGNLLAFGNPDLGDPTYDLPGAQNEVIAITKDQPKSKLLLRSQATETAVKQYGAGFRYLHFATHGTFDAEKPLSSGLLMSSDSENDGTLTVGELYDLRLPADLVTLSACETALGKVANGDDVVGFTRGFLYAGTSSIVSSLWKVDDKATSILMQEFYKSLKESDKRSALRLAQLKVKDTYNSHPYFWAAFQITGSVQ